MSEISTNEGRKGLVLQPFHRATHTHVIGQSGTGKSRTLESWVMQDILAGHGLAVIDPHGDLYQNLVMRISGLLPHYPELANRIILMNPHDPIWTIGFNPLEEIEGIPLQRLAWFLTDVIIKIWQMDMASAPRMLRLITYSFLALAEAKSSLVDLPRFLNDALWRQTLVARTKHREVAEYFRYEFPKKESAAHQWIAPVQNKIGPLLFDPDVRLMLGAKSSINFRRILDENLILLVNLSKGILGEGNSALLGAFIVAHLQQAALSRANSRKRDLFFLYLDEFQNYTTDNIKDILSESRKYGLSLVLAHQYLDQLAGDLRGAVLNTAGTLVAFRVGYQDASILARELFPPGSLKESHRQIKTHEVGPFRVPAFHEEKETLGQEALVTQLTQLRAREFWTKQRGSFPPIKQRSLYLPEPEISEDLLELRERLVDYAGERFGRLKKEVQMELKDERTEHQDEPIFYEKI